MNSLMRGRPSRLSDRSYEEATSHTGVLLAGAVFVGLGLLAWTYLGSDLKRYMKIHSM